MIQVSIDERGTTLEIAMPDGELVSYRPRLPEDRVLELHNQANGNTYTVRPCSPALWQCDCPNWHFRGKKNQPRGCKHSRALADLVRFLFEFRPLIAPLLETQLMSEHNPEVAEVVRRLAEPFDPRLLSYRPGSISNGRALALTYVNARVIQDRLDDVLGVTGWQDEYECLPDGSVVCRLRLRLGDEWVTKTDVGGPSEQPDEGDRKKAAFSDALKRAAVKFGIGRYLYRLPAAWVDYDPQKKQLKSKPPLPDWARPAGPGPRPAATAPAAAAPSAGRGPEHVPLNGIELEERLRAWDVRAAQGGYCGAGELFKYIEAYGRVDCVMKHQPMCEWPADVVRLCWGELQKRAQELKERKKTA